MRDFCLININSGLCRRYAPINNVALKKTVLKHRDVNVKQKQNCVHLKLAL